MKQIIILLLVTLSLNSCNKDDDNNNVTLPPATQTGAGIFACFVNGNSFIDTSGSYFNCFYQFVNGKYYFNISGEVDNQEPCNLDIGTVALEINEGEIYNLFSSDEGNAVATLFFCNELQDYETNSNYTGNLTITKLDFVNNIVSGTFNFTVFNSQTNTEYIITDGRFDTLFTQ